jgi:LysR family pca operon transcriptional activator
MVRRSDAVWIISEGVVALDRDLGELEFLPIDTSETRGAVGLTTLTAAHDLPVMDLMTSCIREAVAEISRTATGVARTAKQRKV